MVTGPVLVGSVVGPVGVVGHGGSHGVACGLWNVVFVVLGVGHWDDCCCRIPPVRRSRLLGYYSLARVVVVVRLQGCQ